MLNIEQNKVHKVSGRKQQDFQKAENRFQNFQGRWGKNPHDLEAWQGMFQLVNNAVFNAVNKTLEMQKIYGNIEAEEIEGRAMDITLTIMARLKKAKENFDRVKIEYNKEVEQLAYFLQFTTKKESYRTADYILKQAGDFKLKEWKIGKLSSYVHNCCLELSNEKYKLWDDMETEDAYFSVDEETGNSAEKITRYNQNGVYSVCEEIDTIQENAEGKNEQSDRKAEQFRRDNTGYFSLYCEWLRSSLQRYPQCYDFHNLQLDLFSFTDYEDNRNN